MGATVAEMPSSLGPWRLLSLLGEGGMGSVYRARREGAGVTHDAALKVLNTAGRDSNRAEALFRREAQALAALNHRGIVKLIDFDRAGDRLYLVTELIDGGSLLELAAKRRMPWELCTYVALEVATALAAAHGLRAEGLPNGLVHGDLSPSNVMLAADGAVKLVDFGLARPTGADVSSENVEGKLAFLPPETVAGAPKDAATDLYALGVTLYVILSGKNPFHGATPAQTFDRVLRAEIPDLQSTHPELPRELSAVVRQLMHRDRGERMSSAAAAAQALEAVLAGRAGPKHVAQWVQEHRSGRAPDGPPTASVSIVVEPQRQGRGKYVALAAVLLAVAAIAAGVARARLTAQPAPEAVAQLPPPAPVEAPHEPAPSAPPAPAPAVATLVLTARPAAAKVLVDGVKVAGTTERLELPITADQPHEVKVVAADGRTFTRTVSAPGGGRTEVSARFPAVRPGRARPRGEVPLDPLAP